MFHNKVSPSWKTEYLNDCITAMRYVVSKVTTIDSGLI